MTIRYICIGCESVLRIKDEKAGSEGRCPKCKMEFMVPFPGDDDDVQGEGRKRPAASAPMEDVDMPLELTPEVEDHPDFDPLDVLGGAMTGARSSGISSPAGTTDKKPTVAELMREFEAGKKKDRKRDSESEVGRPSVAASAEKTVGTATNALSRAYQQKRESASAPVVSAKDAKAAEQHALLMQFLTKQAGPIAVFVCVLVYAYWWHWNRDVYSGVPLYPVNGKVVAQAGDVGGLRVVFMPVTNGINDPRSSAEGVTSADGSFQLIYMEPHKGAPAGKYEVSVFGPSGAPLILTDGTPMLTVSESEENNFEIKL